MDRVAQQLDLTARDFGDNLAIVSGAQRLTWREVKDRSEKAARAFLSRGIGLGDQVALWLPNHPEWLLLWLGAVRIGATVVPINTKYKPDEAAYVLRKSDAKIVFMEDSFLGIDYRSAFATICPDWGSEGRSRSQSLPELREVVVVGSVSENDSLINFLRGGDDISEQRLRTVEDAIPTTAPVIIVFTSGTTGFPKGVVHTHDVVRMVDTVAAWFALGPSDRILGHMPLFHVAGVFSSFMLALMSGGALIQMDHWDTSSAIELVETERITVLSGVPTHFVDVLNCPTLPDHDISSLRTGWIGGSNIPAEVVRGARDVLGMEALLPVYGMTELTSCTTLGRVTDPPESLVLGKGVPLGGYDVAVVDPETRQPLEPGREGEVAVRGYVVMKGYYKEPEATVAVMDDEGWFYTGDLGTFDANGYLSITGRRSAMLIVGGNNVHPADIERVLMDLAWVKTAHVVPRPDDRLGEVPVAFVEAEGGHDPSEEELLGHARRGLASFKVPRKVVFVEEWPMTSTGKVNTAELRRRATQEP